MTSPSTHVAVLRALVDAITEAKATGTWAALLAFSGADAGKLEELERDMRTLLAELEALMQVMDVRQVFPHSVLGQAKRIYVAGGELPLHPQLVALLDEKVMAHIDGVTGQRNDRNYMAYALEYAVSKGA